MQWLLLLLLEVGLSNLQFKHPQFLSHQYQWLLNSFTTKLRTWSLSLISLEECIKICNFLSTKWASSHNSKWHHLRWCLAQDRFTTIITTNTREECIAWSKRLLTAKVVQRLSPPSKSSRTRFPRESSRKAPQVTSLTNYRCRILRILVVKLKKARLYHLLVTKGNKDKVMEAVQEILICSSKVHIKDSRCRKDTAAICIFQITLTLMQTRIKELTRAVKTAAG